MSRIPREYVPGRGFRGLRAEALHADLDEIEDAATEQKVVQQTVNRASLAVRDAGVIVPGVTLITISGSATVSDIGNGEAEVNIGGDFGGFQYLPVSIVAVAPVGSDSDLSTTKVELAGMQEVRLAGSITNFTVGTFTPQYFKNGIWNDFGITQNASVGTQDVFVSAWLSLPVDARDDVPVRVVCSVDPADIEIHNLMLQFRGPGVQGPAGPVRLKEATVRLLGGFTPTATGGDPQQEELPLIDGVAGTWNVLRCSVVLDTPGASTTTVLVQYSSATGDVSPTWVTVATINLASGVRRANVTSGLGQMVSLGLVRASISAVGTGAAGFNVNTHLRESA